MRKSLSQVKSKENINTRNINNLAQSLKSIAIGNSFSQVLNLTPLETKGLKEFLSYDPNPNAKYYKTNFFQQKKSLLSNKGTFPTGLVKRVQGFLGGTIALRDARIAPKPLNLKNRFILRLNGIQPYTSQLAAVEKAAISGRGTISMVTGYGKSVTMALLIAKLQVKTLIVVPNLELKRQLTEVMTRLFGNLNNITIEHIGATSLKTFTNYDCLILDEVHHAAARTYHKLNTGSWGKIYHRFGFTATPFRNQKNEDLLLTAIAGEVLYEVDYKTAVAQEAIVPVEGYYLSILKQNTDAYTYREVYDELVVNNKARNTEISNLLNSLVVAGNPTLCLVKEVLHGEILSKATGVKFANGKDEDSRQYIQDFAEGRLNTLIATVGIAGEGVDSKPAEYIIIAGLGKAKSTFMQCIGRGVRKHGTKESAKIIIFKDTSHKFLLRHFKEQCKVLREMYNVEPMEIT